MVNFDIKKAIEFEVEQRVNDLNNQFEQRVNDLNNEIFELENELAKINEVLEKFLDVSEEAKSLRTKHENQNE